VAKKDKNQHRRSSDTPGVERVPKALYEKELFHLQAELVKLQEWVRLEGKRLVVIF
jgi:polyphosphate kinase 2 (PPK2 family)